MHKLVCKFADRILMLLMAVLAFVLCCQEMFDGDTWWHLRAGRLILETWQIPRVDTFTYESVSRPWIDLHWLFQIVLQNSRTKPAEFEGQFCSAPTTVMTAVLIGFDLPSPHVAAVDRRGRLAPGNNARKLPIPTPARADHAVLHGRLPGRS